MAIVTRKLQNDIKSITDSLKSMKEEAKDCVKVYWSTDVNTLIGAKADSDPVTISTSLTKTQFVSGITLCTELDYFFNDAAVTQSDYLSNCEGIRYGNDTAQAILSSATEALGERMKQVCLDCIQAFKLCRDALDLYTTNEIADCVAVWSSERVVYGADMNNSQLSSGIVIVEQFKKMLNNEAVSTGDYKSTIALWQHL